MSKDAKEDKAREIRRKQDSLWVHADGDNIGEDRRNCDRDGSEPKRSDREDFSSNEVGDRETTLGKILSQLRELREAHLAYINAHSDRLRMRLEEDERHRSAIIAGMDELEQQLILKMQQNRSSEEG